MSDTRTRIEKLRAMAAADESPHEAAIAAVKLAEMGAVPPPPRRPTAVGAPAPGWQPFGRTATVNFTTGQGTTMSGTFYFWAGNFGNEP